VKFIERSFKLEGERGLGRYPRPELIGPLLTHLPQTLQDAVRLGFLHASRPPGRVADALRAAADVRFVGLDAGNGDSTFLTFRAPRLGDAAPHYFAQTSFWEDKLNPEATAFDLLGKALSDVEARRDDSSHIDHPFLRRLAGYRRILKQGISRISLPEYPNAPHMDAAVLKVAEEMARATPPERRVRVTGRLDLMGASQGVLKLHLRPGDIVTALWNGSQSIEEHRELFNQDVMVEGLGVFRPSGSLLRIEADAIAPATVQDEFFREMPVAVPATRDHLASARLRPGERSAYGAIRGSVPVEESDEEFSAAVEEFS